MFRLLLIFAAIISSVLAGAKFRIVNGVEGNIKEFPYLAALLHRGIVRGGATIIKKDAVLTAAHCFKDIVLEKFFVHVGTAFAEKTNQGQVVPVLDYLEHPQYNKLTQNNDIGIVWTKIDFIMNDNVRIIPLPQSNEILREGQVGIAAGWGRLSEDGTFPDNFHFALLPILSTKRCIKSGGGGYDNYRITDNMFCAGYLAGGIDACKSDSGGPFVADGKLVGVVSFGQGCARPKFPGIYTKVSAFKSWIDDNLNKHDQEHGR